MEQKTFTEIGFIRKTQGFKGDVILAVNKGDAEDFLGGEYLFLNMDGSIVPFFIEEYSAEGTSAVIHFEDVNTHEAAVILVSKKVLLPHDELPEFFLEEDELKHLTGFTVVDREKGTLGTVKGIAETPGQLLLIFEYSNSEIMLPVNEQTVLKILKKKREVHVDIPEGLLEVYIKEKKK